MDRRSFIKQTSLTAAVSSLFTVVLPMQKKVKQADKLLNAYYFRAYIYTCVPRQIGDDMRWMADIGTDILSVAVLEQDWYAAIENIAIIAEEADKQGMQLWAVPSRWAGIVAGAPKVPSLFTIRNPQTWMKEDDGKYVDSDVTGRSSSIYSIRIYDFICASCEKMLSIWPPGMNQRLFAPISVMVPWLLTAKIRHSINLLMPM